MDDSLSGLLDENLTGWENLYGKNDAEKGLNAAFSGVIRRAHEKTTSDVLDSVDASSTNPVPVIYQSGYLTIKGYIPKPRISFLRTARMNWQRMWNYTIRMSFS